MTKKYTFYIHKAYVMWNHPLLPIRLELKFSLEAELGLGKRGFKPFWLTTFLNLCGEIRKCSKLFWLHKKKKKKEKKKK